MVYRTVQLDPPWLERGGGKSKRGADKHYPLLPTPQILEVVAGSPMNMAENSHMWMWVTDNFLKDGLWLMENLGFTYKRTFQWVKVKGQPAILDFETGWAVVPDDEDGLAIRYGIGQYARGAHEMMLFGTMGKGQDPSVCTERRDIPSVFFAPVPRDAQNALVHSRKPEAAYELIEARSKGPYLELFARRGREGWTSWGNEVP